MSTVGLSFEETYELLGEIGRGGGGTVIKAYHKRLEKIVVLKKIHANLKSVNARNEADILKNIKSAYLPQVLDFIEHDGDVYTVMEFIEGESFETLLSQGKSFNQKELIKWFKQLTSALKTLHAQKPPIIHGDIKPANIMLTLGGDICLIDFNVSSIFDGKYDHMTGYTPAYAAPEQERFYSKALSAVTTGGGTAFEKTEIIQPDEGSAQNGLVQHGKETARKEALSEMQAAIDTRTDIYSLGATMYHIITGRFPKGGSKHHDVTELRSDICEPLSLIIKKCVAEKPEDRYQSADELEAALANVYQSTRSYQELVYRQNIIRAISFAAMIGFAAMVGIGFRLFRQDQRASYNEYVNMEEKAAEVGDRDALENAYSKAIVIFQSDVEAYEQKGLYLYQAGAYSEGLKFLTEEAIPYVRDNAGLSNLFYLAGMNANELDETDMALELLEEAITYNPENANAYQELAITYAKNSEFEQALEQLELASEKQLSNDSLEYTKGEIYFLQKDYKDAVEAFLKAKDSTDKAYLMMRSYLMLSEVYKADGADPSERVQILIEATERLPEQYLPAVKQQLAQAYIDQNIDGKNESDTQNAITILRNLIDDGYGTFQTYQTLAVVLLNGKRYDEEKDLLDEMLQIYGEDYRIYMYYANAEGLLQEQKPIEERDYTSFAANYLNARELFDEQKTTSATEDEAVMRRLQDAYNQALERGWLDG